MLTAMAVAVVAYHCPPLEVEEFFLADWERETLNVGIVQVVGVRSV